jgi:WD40 repeat protein
MLLYEDHTGDEEHIGIVYALAFSPDGSTLASGGKDGAVYLRDDSGERRTLLERGPNSLPVYSVVFAPGDAVIVGGAFGWRGYRLDGTGNHAGFGPIAPATGLAILDERTIAVGTGDRAKPIAGSFELWNLESGRRREPHFPEPNGVRAVAACPERRIVAWATGHRKVCVWEVLKPEPVQIPQSKNCHAVALSPDGQRLIAAVDYTVKIYDIHKRLELFDLRGHKGTVSSVGVSPDGETIATGSWDGTAKLWCAATGRVRATFKWPIGRVCSLAFAPDGLRIAAGGDIGSVVVWDME